MAKLLDVEETITELEHNLARIRLVTKYFPEVKMKYDTRTLEYIFSDKSVKASSPKVEFYDYTYVVRFSLVKELELDFNGKTEIIKVSGEPKQYTVAGLKYDYNKRNKSNTQYLSTFVFSKPFSCRDKVLQRQIQLDSRLAILKFIQKNPDSTLEKDTLDPRLEKLIIFT